MDEHVLVIPTELFERCGSFQGFKPWDTPLIKASYEPLFDPCNQRFMPRAEAEKDPRFKQLIPYVVLAHLATATVATYERGVGQGESRLHAKRSVGFGGHINPIDNQPGCGSEQYVTGLMRELEEEITIEPANFEAKVETLGLLYDGETEVGTVHLGVAHIIQLPGHAMVHAREKDIVDLRFQPLAKLIEDVDIYESWSGFVINELWDRAMIEIAAETAITKQAVMDGSWFK